MTGGGWRVERRRAAACEDGGDTGAVEGRADNERDVGQAGVAADHSPGFPGLRGRLRFLPSARWSSGSWLPSFHRRSASEAWPT